MWNMDETGFIMGQGDKKNNLVLARTRVKTTQQSNREWVTLIECINAIGKRLPAFYVYQQQLRPLPAPPTQYAYGMPPPVPQQFRFLTAHPTDTHTCAAIRQGPWRPTTADRNNHHAHAPSASVP